MFYRIPSRYRGPRRTKVQRPAAWKELARKHLIQHPTCACCGSESALQVHHIRPRWLYPELELAPHNLITLCESYRYGLNCHLVIGHLGNWSRTNPHVVDDAAEWRRRFAMQPTVNNLIPL